MTRITDERLDIEEIVECAAWKLCALENEVWDETDDSFKARYRREAAQLLAPSRVAQTIGLALSSLESSPRDEIEGRVDILEQSETPDGGTALTLRQYDQETVAVVYFPPLFGPRAPAPVSEEEWLDPSTAPKDGTALRLLVKPDMEAFTSLQDSEDAFETIGFNHSDESGEDTWHFAGWDWSHDCITQGHGEVIGWAAFSPLAALAAKGGQ